MGHSMIFRLCSFNRYLLSLCKASALQVHYITLNYFSQVKRQLLCFDGIPKAFALKLTCGKLRRAHSPPMGGFVDSALSGGQSLPMVGFEAACGGKCGKEKLQLHRFRDPPGRFTREAEVFFSEGVPHSSWAAPTRRHSRRRWLPTRLGGRRTEGLPHREDTGD